MTEQEKFEYIERYLNGQLTAEEQEQFEQLRLTDKDFAEEVTKHQQLNEVIFDAGLLDVKKRVQALQHQKPAGGGRFGKHGSLAKKGLIGLGGLAIVAVGLWVSSNLFEDNPSVSSSQEQPEGRPLSSGSNDQPSEQGQEGSGNTSGDKNNKTEGENSGISKLPAPQKIEPSHEEVAVQESSANKSTEIASAPILSKDQVNNPDLPETQNVDPCQNTQISANPQTVPSCQTEATGKILIDSNSVYGGEAPYKFFIEETDQLVTDYQIEGLESGSYTLVVLDNNDCDATFQNLYIQSKDCTKENEYVFVPEEQSKWKYPFDDNASGELVIRDRNGNQILKEQIRNGIPEGWRGRKNTGQPAPMGAYQVVFTPFDGQPRTWLVTIIR